jgi:hypothetical protein
MNQRFLELAIEARKYAETKPDIYQVAYDKKFAELIVRECAGLVQGVPTDSIGYHTADQKIKEHFGIKE